MGAMAIVANKNVLDAVVVVRGRVRYGRQHTQTGSDTAHLPALRLALIVC